MSDEQTKVKTKVIHEEGSKTTRDGLKLFTQSWRVEGAKGVVLLVHGLAEHSSRYGHVAIHLTNAGFDVYTFDLRGHGRSDGLRAHVDSMDQYIEDLQSIYEDVKGAAGERPVFLLGHSMGGLISTLFTIRQAPDIAGLLLSSPSLKAGSDFSPLIIFVAKVLARLCPKLPLEKLDHKSISKDPKVIEAYDKDPLNYRGGVRAGLGVVLLNAFDEVKRRSNELKVPLLVMMGGADKIVEPSGATELYESAGSTDKTLKIYEGLYHEIMNEPEQDEVFADIHNWLQAHI